MRFLESERIEVISPASRRPRCWIRTARKMRFVVISQSDLGCPVLFAKIFRFTRRANHLYKFAPSHPTKGAYHDRHGRGVGGGGRGSGSVSVRRATWLQGGWSEPPVRTFWQI